MELSGQGGLAKLDINLAAQFTDHESQVKWYTPLPSSGIFPLSLQKTEFILGQVFLQRPCRDLTDCYEAASYFFDPYYYPMAAKARLV